MWPNGPQLDMYFARNHANEALCEAEIRRRCPKAPSAFNQVVACQLRRLANWLAPPAVRPSFDLTMSTSTETRH